MNIFCGGGRSVVEILLSPCILEDASLRGRLNLTALIKHPACCSAGDK